MSPLEVAASPAGYQQNNKGNGADTLNEETDIQPVSDNPEEATVAVSPPADKTVSRESEADVGLPDNRQAAFDHGEPEQTVPHRPDLEADRFYDNDYIPKLRDMALTIIDRMGPITFEVLSKRLARLHGFQRTGRRIRSQVRKAVAKRRKRSRTEDKQIVFWPDGMEPAEVVPFRELQAQGEDRSWTDIPRPELLGLAIDIMKGGRSGDPVDVMSRRLGLARLTQATRKQLTAIIEAAKSKSSDH